MRKITLATVAAAALALGVLAPSGAASAAPTRVGSPVAVAVSGQADSATVTWTPPPAWRHHPILGYTVAISPTEHRRHHGIDVVNRRTTSDRFDHLTAGTTYSFSVRTLAAWGVSTPVTVTYTAPAPTHEESIFALDGTGNLQRRPVTGGAWTTIAPDARGYTVDGAGTAYVLSDENTTITAYPLAGSSRVVASGLPFIDVFRADSAGDLFFTQAASIVELTAGATETHPVAPYSTSWIVEPDGDLLVSSGAQFITYPASGGTPTSVVVSGYDNELPLVADSAGNVYFSSHPGGHASFEVAVQPADGSPARALAGADFVLALSADGDATTLQTASWCQWTGRGTRGCDEDATVSTRHDSRGGGPVTTTPITGLALSSSQGTSSDALAASDLQGNVFLAVVTGPYTGLVKIPAAGGAVQQIDTALHDDVTIR